MVLDFIIHPANGAVILSRTLVPLVIVFYKLIQILIVGLFFFFFFLLDLMVSIDFQWLFIAYND
jgi:hypothetical protein